jgi:uncharacterized protein
VRRIAAALLIIAAWPALALQVADIPTPRPSGWVTDRAGLLSADTVAALNALGDQVHGHNNAELAIVTVRSTAGREHRDFATALFNHWGIGDRARDNGVLIFVAIDDRAAELILGDGLDGPEMVEAAERIMQDEMVARFRAGDPEGAIFAGAQAAALEILGVAGVAAPAPLAAVTSTDATTADAAAAIPGWAPAAGGGLASLGLLWFGGRRDLRSRARRCPTCSAPMLRLEEQADDAHLSAAEQKEEQLKSVDYDVWACSGCGNVVKARYGAFFTRFARCPSCKAVTKASTETTLVSATYDHGGRVRVDERCEACGWRQTSEKATPRRTRSSSSSSSSGFSGGRSSGRGSSGRW